MKKCGFKNSNIKNNFTEFLGELKKFPGYNSWGTKKEIKHLYNALHDGERVLGVASGSIDGNTWLIVCTNIRVIFLDCGMLYGVKQSEILIDKINSISYKNGMVLGEIYIQDGANAKVISNVPKTSTKPFTDAVYKAIEESKKIREQRGTESIVDELMKLKSLMDSGAVTRDEFEALKSKLINS